MSGNRIVFGSGLLSKLTFKFTKSHSCEVEGILKFIALALIPVQNIYHPRS